MKKFFLLTLLLLVGVVQAQETTTGAIGGKLTDKEMGGELSRMDDSDPDQGKSRTL